MELHLEGDRLVSNPVSEWVGPGSFIKSHSGKVMVVDKVNRVNYVCYDENGDAWNVRINGQKPLPRDTPFDKTAYLTKKQQEREKDRENLSAVIASPLTLGSVVKFKSDRDKRKFPHTYVVCIIPNARGNVRLAKLGGDGNRYVNAHFSLVEEVQL